MITFSNFDSTGIMTVTQDGNIKGYITKNLDLFGKVMGYFLSLDHLGKDTEDTFQIKGVFYPENSIDMVKQDGLSHKSALNEAKKKAEQILNEQVFILDLVPSPPEDDYDPHKVLVINGEKVARLYPRENMNRVYIDNWDYRWMDHVLGYYSSINSALYSIQALMKIKFPQAKVQLPVNHEWEEFE